MPQASCCFLHVLVSEIHLRKYSRKGLKIHGVQFLPGTKTDTEGDLEGGQGAARGALGAGPPLAAPGGPLGAPGHPSGSPSVSVFVPGKN